MVKDRLNELVDFATKESPYRSATKGWLNEDLFIQWGSDPKENSLNKGTELINFSLFWDPLSRILSLVFGSLLLATGILCMIIFLSDGRLSIPIETTLATENISRDQVIQGLSQEPEISDTEISENLLDPIESDHSLNNFEAMSGPPMKNPSDKTSKKGLSLI